MSAKDNHVQPPRNLIECFQEMEDPRIDRTRDHNVQQNEMRSQLRQATGEINDLVERFLEQGNDTPDSPPGVDDFLRKLLSDINEEDE